jgi:hypothetical protein
VLHHPTLQLRARRKRKKKCSCKGNNSCSTCGEEEYIEEEEEGGAEETKGKSRRPRKTARMSVGKHSSSETHKLARQLKDQSRRMQQLEADLQTSKNLATWRQTQLEAERKQTEAAVAEQQRLEAEAERLELEAKTAREAKGLTSHVCPVCLKEVNPSLTVAFACLHSFCIPCAQDHLRGCIAVTRHSCLPRKIEVTSLRAKCPKCREDTGVSYTHGAIRLSFPSIDVIAGTGFPYIKPKVLD